MREGAYNTAYFGEHIYRNHIGILVKSRAMHIFYFIASDHVNARTRLMASYVIGSYTSSNLQSQMRAGVGSVSERVATSSAASRLLVAARTPPVTSRSPSTTGRLLIHVFALHAFAHSYAFAHSCLCWFMRLLIQMLNTNAKKSRSS